MSKVLGIIVVFGLITFTAYQIISIIKDIRLRKQSKINKKEGNVE